MPTAALPGTSVERDCEGPVRRRPCQRGCIAASRRRRGGAGAAAPRIRATGGVHLVRMFPRAAARGGAYPPKPKSGQSRGSHRRYPPQHTSNGIEATGLRWYRRVAHVPGTAPSPTSHPVRTSVGNAEHNVACPWMRAPRDRLGRRSQRTTSSSACPDVCSVTKGGVSAASRNARLTVDWTKGRSEVGNARLSRERSPWLQWYWPSLGPERGG
jgi:hypothetical protein